MFNFLLIICLFSSHILFANDTIKKGDILFEAADYQKALTCYQEALNKPDKSPLAKNYLNFKIAQINCLTEDYKTVIDMLEENVKTPSDLYLLCFSYRQLNYPEKTVELLNKHTDIEVLPEIKLELAISLYETDQLTKSETLLKKLQKVDRIKDLSSLYLARIHIKKGALNQAEERLNTIPNETRYLSEKLFEYGNLSYLKKDFHSALNYYEQTIKTPANEKLTQETLFRLSQTKKNLGLYYDAEKILLDLSLEDNRTTLALVESRLLHSQDHVNEIPKLKELLIRAQKPIDHNLFLVSLIEENKQQKQKLLRKLTRSKNKNNSFFGLAWLYKGLEFFEDAKKERRLHNTKESSFLFERSLQCLKKAEENLYPEYLQATCLLKKIQAYSYYNQSSQKSLQNCIETLDFFDKSSQRLQLIEHPDEIYYLKGLALAKLSNSTKSTKVFNQCLECLKDNLSQYPQGRFTANTLYLIGILSLKNKEPEQAESYFIRLAKDFPNSPLSPESLFWASVAEPNKVIGREYLHQIFTEYPSSKIADSAYFSYFSLDQYLNEAPGAKTHLLEISKRFPNSPYNLYAYYIKGINLKKQNDTLIQSIEAFQDVEDAFDKLYVQGLILDNQLAMLANIKYRAILERARANLVLAQNTHGSEKLIYLDYTENVLESILSDFKETNHSVTKHLINGEAFPYILEETNFWLAQVFFQAKKTDQSKIILTEMLKKYHSAKITRGYYLSRVWTTKALIEMKEKQFEKALLSFQKAKDAAKGKILASNEILDLLICESECYKQLGNLDQAMLILSKVINYNAVSELRIKAMYLRAEIYQKQKRHDLAMKQLEATAKKGGSWAVKAEKKLRENYVY